MYTTYTAYDVHTNDIIDKSQFSTYTKDSLPLSATVTRISNPTTQSVDKIPVTSPHHSFAPPGGGTPTFLSPADCVRRAVESVVGMAALHFPEAQRLAPTIRAVVQVLFIFNLGYPTEYPALVVMPGGDWRYGNHLLRTEELFSTRRLEEHSETLAPGTLGRTQEGHAPYQQITFHRGQLLETPGGRRSARGSTETEPIVWSPPVEAAGGIAPGYLTELTLLRGIYFTELAHRKGAATKEGYLRIEPHLAPSGKGGDDFDHAEHGMPMVNVNDLRHAAQSLRPLAVIV
ncbi:hypothetical protein CMUS01_01505 [Colletotrichum musicola]|uniref:Uncharacterized protein n=1 Tax=Colletotrichum musicola TaxID=2175873 RepID=A0A8H6NWU2_9PEZI|nr:hypothetical protein CMUS01_01505 [Colletotrichum musicola]